VIVDKLRSCPFCNANAVPGCEFGIKRMHYYSQCLECGAQGPSFAEDEGGAKAAAMAWNERLVPRDELLRVARLIEDMKQECGMDPESPTAIRNGRYMSIGAILRGLAK
jgi:hypothetical protein